MLKTDFHINFTFSNKKFHTTRNKKGLSNTLLFSFSTKKKETRKKKRIPNAYMFSLLKK